jgi:tight adherence protein B
MEFLAAATAMISVLFLAAYAIRSRALNPEDTRLRVLTPLSQVVMEDSGAGGAILRRGGSAIPFLNKLLNRRGYADRWRFDLDRAGLTLRPGEYLLVRLVIAAVLFVTLMAVMWSPLGLMLGVVAGAVAYMVPAFWVRLRINRRVRVIEQQLAETITLIANAQRSGFAFSQGVDVAAKRMGPPISIELNRMLLDINMGASTEDALAAMNDRIGSEDLDLIVTAILIQRQTGGNLVEVLDNVTEIMRDRERIKGDIKSLTASQRLSGFILSVWPAALGLIFFAINPSAMSLMWTTLPGLIMLVTWGTLNLLGVFTMRRILDIDI